MSRRCAAALVFSIAIALPMSASAQASSAMAEKLFREGEQLFKRGKTHEACEKFAESQRIDPGLGTLMNLAICHEREGKLATAWGEYTDVAQQATAAHQDGRAKNAQARAAALEPKVPYLKLVFADASTVEQVKIDGQTIGRAGFTSPVPVDPGTHAVVASATGRKSVSKDVVIDAPGTKTLDLPALEPEEKAPEPVIAPSTEVPPTTSSPPPEEPASSGNGQRLVGYVVGGVGLVGIGVGAFFGLRAFSKASEGNCSGTICDQTGLDARNDSRTAANISNVAFGVGIVALATGVVLVLTAPKRHSSPTASVAVTPFGIGGRFQ